MKNKKIISIMGVVIFSCIVMAFVETIVEPGYLIKSLIKVFIFLGLPLIFMRFLKDVKVDKNFILNKKDILRLLLLGIFIYSAIMICYFLTKSVFNYKDLVVSLSHDQGVSSKCFIWIALYISFGNSFLEEFLFRYLSFIKLSNYVGKKVSYIFSSLMFSIYHIAMAGESFPLPLLLLSLFGLGVGGLIFDLIDSKNNNIYNSWIVHMFADFAIMTIWFINI